jgi:hypothetical protein
MATRDLYALLTTDQNTLFAAWAKASALYDPDLEKYHCTSCEISNCPCL